MKLLTLIIWLIGFPLATTITRYYSEKLHLMMGEPFTLRSNLNYTGTMELIIFFVVIFLLITSILKEGK